MTPDDGETPARPTRKQAIAAAGACLAQARADQAARSPREAAEAAWRPGGPSVNEIEDRIRQRRGLPPVRRDDAVGGAA